MEDLHPSPVNESRARSGSILDAQFPNDDDGGKTICGFKIPKAMWVALVVSMGGTLEWYDFAVYGFVAKQIGASFFPEDSDQTTKLIETYGIFSLAFICRVAGGVIFGMMGDKGGGSSESRQHALESAILVMALPTLLLGLLPTYSVIGWVAPVVVALIRCAQAFAVGGQLVGAIVYAAENAPLHRQALYTGVALSGASSGTLLGAAIGEICMLSFGPELMMKGAWRLLFIIGFLISVGAYMIQRGLRKPPEEESTETAPDEVLSEEADIAPPSEVAAADAPGCCALLKMYPWEIGAVVGVYGIWTGSFYMSYLFMPTYLSSDAIGYDERGTFGVNLMGLFILICGAPTVGFLVDRHDDSDADHDNTPPVPLEGAKLLCVNTPFSGSLRKWRRFQVLAGACIATLVTAPITLACKIHMGWAAIVLTQMWSSALHAILAGLISAWMVAIFPRDRVYSCIALGLNLATVIFGGSAPMICMILSTINKAAPSGFLVLASLAGLAGLFIAARCEPIEVDLHPHEAVSPACLDEDSVDEVVDAPVEPGIEIKLAGQVPGS